MALKGQSITCILPRYIKEEQLEESSGFNTP